MRLCKLCDYMCMKCASCACVCVCVCVCVLFVTDCCNSVCGILTTSPVDMQYGWHVNAN